MSGSRCQSGGQVGVTAKNRFGFPFRSTLILCTWTCCGRMLGNDVVSRLVVFSCTKAVLLGYAPGPRAATSHSGAWTFRKNQIELTEDC